MYNSITHAQIGQKRMLDSRELEFQMYMLGIESWSSHRTVLNY